MDGCVFCKIIAGEFGTIIAQNEHAVAFYDINPAQPLHILVVPREHHGNVAELAFANPDALVAVMQLGSQLANELTDGNFRFTFNTGPGAGQTVFHAHGHIMSKSPKK